MLFCIKQKTAYELRISDWSSDVCSSDLEIVPLQVDSPDSALLSLRHMQRQSASGDQRHCRHHSHRLHKGAAHEGSSLPACSRTMYSAYQSGQFASCWPPVRFSCSPCAAAARWSAAARRSEERRGGQEV